MTVTIWLRMSTPSADFMSGLKALRDELGRCEHDARIEFHDSAREPIRDAYRELLRRGRNGLGRSEVRLFLDRFQLFKTALPVRTLDGSQHMTAYAAHQDLNALLDFLTPRPAANNRGRLPPKKKGPRKTIIREDAVSRVEYLTLVQNFIREAKARDHKMSTRQICRLLDREGLAIPSCRKWAHLKTFVNALNTVRPTVTAFVRRACFEYRVRRAKR